MERSEASPEFFGVTLGRIQGGTSVVIPGGTPKIIPDGIPEEIPHEIRREKSGGTPGRIPG